MAQPFITTKRAARLSLVGCVLAQVVFVLLPMFVDGGRRLWAWGGLLSPVLATFSTVTAVRAPD